LLKEKVVFNHSKLESGMDRVMDRERFGAGDGPGDGDETVAAVVPMRAAPQGERAQPELCTLVRQLYASQPERPGCPISRVKTRLRESGLRPTRQRVVLGWMLFAKGHRHVSAEQLFEEANRARAALSLATVYNTLRQFTEAGLLRQVHMGAGKAWFDTNTGEHHHFVVDGEETVFDVEAGRLQVSDLPEAPPGYAIMGVDVVVRLKRIGDD
jgi:Fur family iron response transcriptional regulator